jgi:hypothetical protein
MKIGDLQLAGQLKIIPLNRALEVFFDILPIQHHKTISLFAVT